MKVLKDDRVYVIRTDHSFNRTHVEELDALSFFREWSGLTVDGTVVTKKFGAPVKECKTEEEAFTYVKEIAEFNLFHSSMADEFFFTKEKAEEVLAFHKEREDSMKEQKEKQNLEEKTKPKSLISGLKKAIGL